MHGEIGSGIPGRIAAAGYGRELGEESSREPADGRERAAGEEVRAAVERERVHGLVRVRIPRGVARSAAGRGELRDAVARKAADRGEMSAGADVAACDRDD